MTISTTTIPAGWYKDPAGSSALRWWDGTQWTDNLQQPTPPPPPAFTPVEPQPAAFTSVAPLPPVAQQPGVLPPVAQQQVAQQPEISLSRYSPTTGYAQQPRDTAWGNDPYANRMPVTSVPHNNAVAWISFAAGIVSLGTIVIVAMFPGNYFFPFFGLTAILTGIRAIIRYRSRRVTILWAPIIGIVFGAIAELILISGYVLAAIPGAVPASAPTPTSVIGPTGSTINYDMGAGSLQYLPASNGTLSQAAQDESKIVSVLQTDYANGTVGAAADGKWPSDVTHTSGGDVTTSDGRDLGDLIPAGWHLAYSLQSDGSFLLGVSGPDTSEVAIYGSDQSQYAAWCEATDVTCKTDSPVAPFTSNGSSTANPAVPTNT